MRFFTKAQSEYVPWNKGKIIGQKPPLQAKHVWAIRTRLQLAKKIRDLAMFNLAIDSKASRLRRGCLEGRGRGTERLCGRTGDDPPDEDQPAGDVRNH